MATKKDINNLRALLVPAGVITGMGFGFLIDNVIAGLFIGLGVGLALVALVAIFMTDKTKE